MPSEAYLRGVLQKLQILCGIMALTLVVTGLFSITVMTIVLCAKSIWNYL